jgi:hypothetical protein
MRKLIFTLLLGAGFAGLTQAQVIFDPAKVSATDTAGWGANGAKIVAVDGVKYVQVIVNGWNSSFFIPKFTFGANLGVKCKMKYSVGPNSKFKNSEVLGKVQLMDTANKVPDQWAASGFSPANLALLQQPATGTFTVAKATVVAPMTGVQKIQVYGQDLTGWKETYGDTIWFGAISAYDVTAIMDPASYDVSGTAITHVTIDGVDYLKVPTDLGWDTFLNIDEFSSGDNYNQYNVPVKVEIGSATKVVDGTKTYFPKAIDSLQVAINPQNASSANVGGVGATATSAFSTMAVPLTPNTITTRFQIALQYKTGNWAATTGAFIYIGKITAVKVTDKMVDARLRYEVAKVPYELDLYAEEEDPIWSDANVVSAPIENVALGTKPAATDNSGSFQMVWNEKFLYVLVKVKDQTVVPIANTSKDEPWNNDGIELFFDRKDQRPEGKRYKTEQSQLRINNGALQVTGEGGIFNSNAFNAGRWGSEAADATDEDTLNWSISNISGGYQIYARFPWLGFYRTNSTDKADSLKTLAAADIKAGKKFAFEMSLLDADVYNVRKSILNWCNNTGSDQAYSNCGVWGGFELKAGEAAVKYASANAFRMYPNPASSVVNVSAKNLRSIEVVNVSGQVVAKQIASSDNATVGVAGMKAGIYFVKVYDANGYVGARKLMVK